VARENARREGGHQYPSLYYTIVVFVLQYILQ